jgi:hypothetical protein
MTRSQHTSQLAGAGLQQQQQRRTHNGVIGERNAQHLQAPSHTISNPV